MSPYFLLVGMIGLTAGLRLVEHPWNIAPMGALSLFAGAHFRDKRWAFAVPLIALLLGDVALGAIHRNFSDWTFHAFMPVNYLCYALSVCLGLGVQRTWKRIDALPQEPQNVAEPVSPARRRILKAIPVAGATATGGILFFLITNFGVWALYPTYPRTWEGLVTCYDRALPFFRNTMMSDAFYVVVMFTGYAALRPTLKESTEAEGVLS